MKILDRIPLLPIIFLCAFLGLAPFTPEPHIWQKLKMLTSGTLTNRTDIFDFLLHGAPWVLLVLKLLLSGSSKSKVITTSDEIQATTVKASETLEPIRSQFWACYFPDEESAMAFMDEDPDHYAEENEDKEYPLSKFSASQGEWFYDHDNLEFGFYPNFVSVQESLKGHSWADKWSAEFERRLRAAGSPKINGYIMMTESDRFQGKVRFDMKVPRSVEGDGYKLYFLGEIEYGI